MNYQQEALKSESKIDAIQFSPTALSGLMWMSICMGQIMNLVKREVFYDKPMDPEQFHNLLGHMSIPVEYLIEQNAREGLAKAEPIEGVEADHSKLDPRLLHAAIGLYTEAGEILEALFEQMGGGQLDTFNIAEELGDIDWYKALAHDAIDVSEEATRAANLAKLAKRYKDGQFSAEQSENRDTVAERLIIVGSL